MWSFKESMSIIYASLKVILSIYLFFDAISSFALELEKNLTLIVEKILLLELELVE